MTGETMDKTARPGYTSKTIPEVFGLKPGMKSLIVNQPEDYGQIMNGWKFENSNDKLDFIHLFAKSKHELAHLVVIKQKLKPDGMIWVSWLKKSSGIPTDVTENDIRNLALNLGLVDVKVCAVSDIWSGLKLVIPVANR